MNSDRFTLPLILFVCVAHTNNLGNSFVSKLHLQPTLLLIQFLNPVLGELSETWANAYNVSSYYGCTSSTEDDYFLVKHQWD